MTAFVRLLTLGLFALALGCGRTPDGFDHNHDHDHEHDEPPTNRIATPPLVRSNLGIEFVTVERRRVAATMRLPGAFELLPSGRHDYRAPLGGRVQLLVEPLQQVEEGEPLFLLDAPRWRQMQRDLAELSARMGLLRSNLEALGPRLAAHQNHERSIQQARAVVQQRIGELAALQQDLGGQAQGLAELRVQEAQLGADLAEAGEKHAELTSQQKTLQAELAADEERFKLALDAAASVLSTSPGRLLAQTDRGLPLWRTLAQIEVRARASGAVDQMPLSSGAWIDENAQVLSLTDRTRLRFVARALQSDLHRLQDGLPCAIVPAALGVPQERIQGDLRLALSADADQRTVDLFVLPKSLPAWARPQVAAFVEIEVQSGAVAELAVPSAAIVQDGTSRVLFLRDPKDEDQVIRIEADLGVDDGRFVEVKSGLCDGDSVVVAGAYELALASSKTAQKGGHFHADGTFHSDEDHE